MKKDKKQAGGLQGRYFPPWWKFQ